MQLASSIHPLWLVLGFGVSACGNSTTPIPPTSYTWTQVSTDMRSTCAISTSCHARGTTQPFSYDSGLVAGSDLDNYNGLMAAMLIDLSAPASSPLIVIGRGGMYMGKTHGTNLSGTLANLWTGWITSGATYP